jgi:hypothetical protein
LLACRHDGLTNPPRRRQPRLAASPRAPRGGKRHG